MEFKNNIEYEIKTSEGWCGFKGIKKSIIPYYFIVSFDDETILKGSENHQVQLSQGSFWEISLLEIGDELMGGKKVVNIECIEEEIEVYDVLNINNNSNSYIASNIIHHNCAFIDNIEEIFTSIRPTISTGGKIIALSSPNGVGNWFHRKWAEALSGENSFYPILLPWNVHPDRDLAWFEKEKLDMTPKEIAQEYECDFLASGETFIDQMFLNNYESIIKDPKEKRHHGDLWIWVDPDYSMQYIVAADVARGDGADYSAFHVICVETTEQVAEFKGKLPTREFAHLLMAIASEYNNALLSVENSSIGWDVVNEILEKGYQNFYHSPRGNVDMSMEAYSRRVENNQTVPGFSIGQAIRPLVISKMESYIRDRVLTFYSKRLLNELRTFVWIHGKPQAMKGYNDDLVMSIGQALYLRDTAMTFFKSNVEQSRAALSAVYKSSGNGPVFDPQNPYHMPTHGGGFENIDWLL